MELKRFSGKRICVAVSGGVDSVALLHCLKTAEKACGFSLSAVHCEHGIRGAESVEDMRFVQDLCAELGVPLFVFQEDCFARAKRDKESLETAARHFRYACFAALIEDGKADLIAMAHHQGDEAETVLFRIARGASLTGASGMKAENGWLIRPFLDWTRAKIEAYAQANGLQYRFDKTNADMAYTRNRLRAEVLPALEEAVPGATENIGRFAVRAAEDDELLYEYALGLVREAWSEDGEREYLVAFCEKKPLMRRACLWALKALGVERDYTALHLEQACDLQGLERGAKLDLPRGVQAIKTDKGILFHIKKTRSNAEKPSPKKFDISGFDGGRYAVSVSETPIKEDGGVWRTLRVDGDKMPADAVFRFRKDGDVIKSFGGGTKTLKKLFNEKKTPVEARGYLPLIAAADGEQVYVVCGVEIADCLRVTEKTERVLYIGVRKKD